MDLVRRLVVSLLAASIASGALAATSQLNPTVKVLPKAQSAVPTDCDEGLAPAAPRAPIETYQAAAPANVAPPPSSDLRTRFRRVQTAADREDYEAFKSSLADVRSGIATFPGGGERDAANNVLQVYADLERLWDYAFTARTGAFFDASTQDGALLNTLRRYPDYQRSIAGQTMTIGGQTIYPSRESRLFLINEAAKRLTRLGVRTPTRLAQQPRLARTPPRAQPTKAVAHPVPAKRAPVKIAEAKPKPKRKSHPATRHEEPVAAPAPSTPPPPVPTPTPAPATTTTVAPPPTETTSTNNSGAPKPALSAAEGPSAANGAAEGRGAPPTATETTASAPPTTTQPAQPSKPQAGGGMNLMFAIILIVVGIGVLIVLFRASD